MKSVKVAAENRGRDESKRDSIFFQHFRPRQPLSEFIDMFWFWQGYDLPEGKERCLPSGTVEFVISLHSNKSADSIVGGMRSESFILHRSSTDCLIAAHFKPGGIFPFLRTPASEIRNLDLTIEDLWGARAATLRSQLLEAGTLQARFAILEGWFMALFLNRPREFHPAVACALQALGKIPGEASLPELADKIGISQRRLIQVFNAQVGLTPKLYSRVARFQEVLRQIQRSSSPPDWLNLALSCGYFDQAHFIHDFQEFSGLTPSVYLLRATQHLNHVPIPD